MSPQEHTVVIGAGLAAAHTVEALREGGYDGRITLIGAEPDPPYERPPLSKDYLQGRQEREKAIVHDASWYRGRGIDLRLGRTATDLEAASRTVVLDDGTGLEYTHLVLATGAVPRRPGLPGEELPGVHVLRRFEDSEKLKEVFDAGGRLAVVGAGWIGLEVAASARQAGMEVTIVAPDDVPLAKVMGPELGAYFAQLHHHQGVELRLGSTVTGILERDGRAAGLQTSDGDVPADAVLLAVGAVPLTELAEGAGLEVGNGVVVDSRLRASEPGILAVGDVANAQHATLGRLRVEHWDNAIRQGKLAAATILGRDEVYDWQPYFFTDQFDLGMEYVGRGGPDARTVVRGELEAGEFIVFWLDGDGAEGSDAGAGRGGAASGASGAGTVAAAMNVNIWDVNDALRALIGRSVDADRLADPSIPLDEL
ncbi:NAD(P)/FAD-dependent oxidoreductase [Zafaria sp. Z1313]|uniref:NAD(P)/FAD-dependent oxidoreductase n=1 Tax=unclassified Zafaria TaxID=2828765 RepID=UPI002E78A281|nr:FAD-dependent oxidoreductase [Zafaria sp. J156]MEE1621622.1 FAD-dependent oxidoreductase [Zafaria sp. J156]